MRENLTCLLHAWRTLSPATRPIAMCNFAPRFLLLASLAFAASSPIFAQTEPPQPTSAATVEGIVRDAGGKPVAGASVALLEQRDATSVQSKTNVDGTFAFLALRAGTFTVKVEKTGLRGTVMRSLELSEGEKKHIDLVLDAQVPAEGATGQPIPPVSSSDKMGFSDQPNFTVAGMTDWSNLGLHGSDSTSRTSEALAKETLALKSASAESAGNGGAGTAAAYRLSGDRDERLGDPVAAVHEYEQAARLDPSEENYFAWGSELLLHRAAQPASEVFAKGSALHSKSARMLAGLGAALYANGLYDEAARRLCEASDLNPADSAPYLFLGKMEETATAPFPCGEEKLARFAREQPANALANYYYELSLTKRERVSDNPAEFHHLEKLLEKAVSIDPALGEAYVQLGILYSTQGDLALATQVLKKAIEVNPDLGAAHYRLSLVYERMDEEAKARQEIGIYKQCEKAETDRLERQRRELRQFLVILKDQPSPAQPK
jgi:tetratricopeptide (TPR) repeat protein